MKKNLKKYKVKPKQEKIPCQCCDVEYKELCSISIRTYDVEHRYISSNRPMVTTYRIRCCPKCFKKLMKKMNKIAYDIL